jgi:hypothetical protein
MMVSVGPLPPGSMVMASKERKEQKKTPLVVMTQPA